MPARAAIRTSKATLVPLSEIVPAAPRRPRRSHLHPKNCTAPPKAPPRQPLYKKTAPEPRRLHRHKHDNPGISQTTRLPD